jgi:hypothetical protein
MPLGWESKQKMNKRPSKRLSKRYKLILVLNILIGVNLTFSKQLERRIKMARKSDALFIRLDPELKRRLNEQADRMNTSASVIVRMGTIKLLEELEQTDTSNPRRDRD